MEKSLLTPVSHLMWALHVDRMHCRVPTGPPRTRLQACLVDRGIPEKVTSSKGHPRSSSTESAVPRYDRATSGTFVPIQ